MAYPALFVVTKMGVFKFKFVLRLWTFSATVVATKTGIFSQNMMFFLTLTKALPEHCDGRNRKCNIKKPKV